MKSNVEISIIIVHAFAADELRETLRSVYRAAPQIPFEILIVDNETEAGIHHYLRQEFPEVRYFPMEKNVGFGAGMNVGIKEARGRYTFVFNPDIVLHQGTLEKLHKFMEEERDIGIAGPRLLNPDGSLQHSCYRIPSAWHPIMRRTPVGRLAFGKRLLEDYFMTDADHEAVMDVDSLLGGAMFCRTHLLHEIDLFDERFFIYYEDNDLCRRMWEHGYRVTYCPHATMVHYHNRATARGGLLKQILSPLTWRQIESFVKYMVKYAKKPNPRHEYESRRIS
jgi:hypothetical protein